MTDAVAPVPVALVPLDPERVSEDFPILAAGPNTGARLAFLDSAASAMKPRQVIESLRATYEGAYANVHRGVYAHAATATAAFEGAREKVRALLGRPLAARGRSSRAAPPRRSTSSRIPGAAPTSARATSSCSPSWSTTRTSCRGSRPAPRPARSCASSRSMTTACSTCPRSTSSRQAVACGWSASSTSPTRSARTRRSTSSCRGRKSHDALVLLDAAQIGTASRRRRAGAGRRLPRVLGAQGDGTVGRGRAVGARGAARRMPPWQFGGEMIRARRVRRARRSTTCRGSSRPAPPRSPR